MAYASPVKKTRVSEIPSKDCKTCQYRGTDSNLGGLCCNYILVTGRSRTKTPEGCVHYKKGEKITRWVL